MLERPCNCPVCTARRALAPDQPSAGRSMVIRYMESFHISREDAVEQLEAESRSMFVAACATVMGRTGCPYDVAADYVVTHTVPAPGEMQ